MLSYSDFVYGCHADAWFCCHMLLRHTCVLVSYCCDAACLVELFCWLVLMLIATLTLTLNLVSDCCANGCLLFNVIFAENVCWRLVIISCWHLLIMPVFVFFLVPMLVLFCYANSCLWFLFWCLLVFLVPKLACCPCADVRLFSCANSCLFFLCRWLLSFFCYVEACLSLLCRFSFKVCACLISLSDAGACLLSFCWCSLACSTYNCLYFFCW